VASVSRLLKIIGLFCKRALYKRLYSAKETYNFKEPTNGSHRIPRESDNARERERERERESTRESESERERERERARERERERARERERE